MSGWDEMENGNSKLKNKYGMNVVSVRSKLATDNIEMNWLTMFECQHSVLFFNHHKQLFDVRFSTTTTTSTLFAIEWQWLYIVGKHRILSEACDWWKSDSCTIANIRFTILCVCVCLRWKLLCTFFLLLLAGVKVYRGNKDIKPINGLKWKNPVFDTYFFQCTFCRSFTAWGNRAQISNNTRQKWFSWGGFSIL